LKDTTSKLCKIRLGKIRRHATPLGCPCGKKLPL
jgi:hypothetical protein